MGANGMPRTTIYELLREGLKEQEDQEMLNGVSYEDRIEVGFPAFRKDAKLTSSVTERSEMFYYYHLSPFARKAVTQTYGKDNKGMCIEERRTR